MKILSSLLLSTLVVAHGLRSPGGDPDYHTMTQWNRMKSLQQCWGEENAKIHTIQIKEALARCQQTDAPELELPIFRSPYRFVSSLISGSNQVEQRLSHIINRMVQQQQHQGSNINYNPNNMINQFQNYNPNNNQDMANNYNPNQNNQFQSQYQSAMQSNFYEILEQINQENIQDSHRSPLTYANFLNPKYRGFEQSPLADLPYQGGVAVESRFKRQEHVDTKPHGSDASNLPGFLNLFDRLADKLKAVEKREDEEVGNYTCVLRHLHVIDHNNNIDVRGLVKNLDNYNIPSKWLKDQQINNYETCHQMAENIPRHDQEYVEEGKPDVAKINSFIKCYRKAGSKTCMYQDIKIQLENNFGPLDLLLEQTQLTENQIFRLVFELLYKDTLDFF